MAGNTEKKKSFQEDSDDSFGKKLKMRTASDVISRLQWDDSLPKDFFTVGYLDRFKGLVEKPFVTLDWSDPAIVDNYTLALPKHRIQYFKYKTRKVWDKTTRKDFVFGSTGELIDIHTLMKEVDDEEFNFFDECLLNFDYDDDMKPALKLDEYDISNRPNYFIAARIVNEDIVSKLNNVSENIKIKDPMLSECCIKTCEYHITLSILKLDSIEEIVEVANVLQKIQNLQLKEPKIVLDKLSVFQHRVLHARVKPNEEFNELREQLVRLLEEKKINITDKYSFVPHATILKLSRPIQRAIHSKYIDPSLYIASEEEHFGTQLISKLYLCEMKDIRREDGFYKCAAEVDILQSSA